MTETGQRVYAFGPFGVSICDGRYGIFKWQWQNVTLIELTEHSIRGIPRGPLNLFKPRSSARCTSFDIPYPTITSLQLLPHPARLGLMQVLDIQYREGEQIREKSIVAYNQPAEEAFALLRRLAPQAS